jgi:hypothetical protein
MLEGIMETQEIFASITRIAQGNIQEVLVAMLEKIVALEEALDALNQEPEVVHGPDPMAVARLEAIIESDNKEFEKCQSEDESISDVEESLEEEELEAEKPETKDNE